MGVAWTFFLSSIISLFILPLSRAYCACSRCGWGLLGHFFLVCHFSFHILSLWETAQYRLKYCLKGPLSPNQPTKQPAGMLCYYGFCSGKFRFLHTEYLFSPLLLSSLPSESSCLLPYCFDPSASYRVISSHQRG